MADDLSIRSPGAGASIQTAVPSEKKVDKGQEELSRLKQIAKKKTGKSLSDNQIKNIVKRRQAKKAHQSQLKETKQNFETSQAKEQTTTRKPQVQAAKTTGAEGVRSAKDGLTTEDRKSIASDPDAGPKLPPTKAKAPTPEQAKKLVTSFTTLMQGKDGKGFDLEAYAKSLKKQPPSQPKQPAATKKSLAKPEAKGRMAQPAPGKGQLPARPGHPSPKSGAQPGADAKAGKQLPGQTKSPGPQTKSTMPRGQANKSNAGAQPPRASGQGAKTPAAGQPQPKSAAGVKELASKGSMGAPPSTKPQAKPGQQPLGARPGTNPAVAARTLANNPMARSAMGGQAALRSAAGFSRSSRMSPSSGKKSGASSEFRNAGGGLFSDIGFDGMNFNWDAFFTLFLIKNQKDMHAWKKIMKEFRQMSLDSELGAYDLSIALEEFKSSIERNKSALQATQAGLQALSDSSESLQGSAVDAAAGEDPEQVPDDMAAINEKLRGTHLEGCIPLTQEEIDSLPPELRAEVQELHDALAEHAGPAGMEALARVRAEGEEEAIGEIDSELEPDASGDAEATIAQHTSALNEIVGDSGAFPTGEGQPTPTLLTEEEIGRMPEDSQAAYRAELHDLDEAIGPRDMARLQRTEAENRGEARTQADSQRAAMARVASEHHEGSRTFLSEDEIAALPAPARATYTQARDGYNDAGAVAGLPPAPSSDEPAQTDGAAVAPPPQQQFEASAQALEDRATALESEREGLQDRLAGTQGMIDDYHSEAAAAEAAVPESRLTSRLLAERRQQWGAMQDSVRANEASVAELEMSIHGLESRLDDPDLPTEDRARIESRINDLQAEKRSVRQLEAVAGAGIGATDTMIRDVRPEDLDDEAHARLDTQAGTVATAQQTLATARTAEADAQTALNDLPADATQEQRDTAQSQLTQAQTQVGTAESRLAQAQGGLEHMLENLPPRAQDSWLTHAQEQVTEAEGREPGAEGVTPAQARTVQQIAAATVPAVRAGESSGQTSAGTSSATTSTPGSTTTPSATAGTASTSAGGSTTGSGASTSPMTTEQADQALQDYDRDHPLAAGAVDSPERLALIRQRDAVRAAAAQPLIATATEAALPLADAQQVLTDLEAAEPPDTAAIEQQQARVQELQGPATAALAGLSPAQRSLVDSRVALHQASTTYNDYRLEHGVAFVDAEGEPLEHPPVDAELQRLTDANSDVMAARFRHAQASGATPPDPEATATAQTRLDEATAAQTNAQEQLDAATAEYTPEQRQAFEHYAALRQARTAYQTAHQQGSADVGQAASDENLGEGLANRTEFNEKTTGEAVGGFIQSAATMGNQFMSQINQSPWAHSVDKAVGTAIGMAKKNRSQSAGQYQQVVSSSQGMLNQLIQVMGMSRSR